MRKNEACFLEDDPWQNLICSTAANQAYIRRGYMGVSLLCLMTRIPRLMRDVTRVVNDRDGVAADALNSLAARIRRFRTSLKKWRANFEGMLPNLRHSQIGSPVTDESFELQCANLTLQTLACRMLSAICMDMAAALESEAQTYAAEVADAEREVAPRNVWAGLYITQKAAITGATVRTKHLWKGDSGIIERWRFKAWCDEFPRSCGPD